MYHRHESQKFVCKKTKNIEINVDKKNIIMTGIHNPRDGLYEIPVTKNYIQENNFVLPPITSIPSLSILKLSKDKMIKKVEKKVTFTPKLKRTVDNLNIKKFSRIIDPVIVKNTKNFIPVAITNNKINVILRKDKTKHDLVSFLHRAMCLPDPKTWEKAIKTGILFHGLD